MDISPHQEDFSFYLRPQHQIRAGFQLSENKVIELNAVVVAIAETVIQLETFGRSTNQLALVPIGSSVVLLSSENWAFCRFQGQLTTTFGREFTVKLHGEPEIEQRREHFRMDVNIPVCYSMPDDQQLSKIEGIWKVRRMLCEFTEQPKIISSQGSFKVLKWEDGADIEPSRVNLSGGGLRIKTPSSFPQGALLNLNLFLPVNSFKVVDAVASVIRSTEIRLTLDNRPAYTTAMKFIFLSENDRERIITYIFNEQRNQMRSQF